MSRLVKAALQAISYESSILAQEKLAGPGRTVVGSGLFSSTESLYHVKEYELIGIDLLLIQNHVERLTNFTKSVMLKMTNFTNKQPLNKLRECIKLIWGKIDCLKRKLRTSRATLLKSKTKWCNITSRHIHSFRVSPPLRRKQQQQLLRTRTGRTTRAPRRPEPGALWPRPAQPRSV